MDSSASVKTPCRRGLLSAGASRNCFLPCLPMPSSSAGLSQSSIGWDSGLGLKVSRAFDQRPPHRATGARLRPSLLPWPRFPAALGSGLLAHASAPPLARGHRSLASWRRKHRDKRTHSIPDSGTLSRIGSRKCGNVLTQSMHTSLSPERW